ncbi:MAG: hypothetical protein AB7V45_13435 [Candidatus Krumholzibacteriia bacterium]
MKTAVSMTMVLMIGTLAISTAFGETNPVGAVDVASTLDAANAGYANQFGPDPVDPGAPNSGDCIPDGSGWDHDDHGAPNSGDGIPDGSGWTTEDLGAPNPYSLFLLVFPLVIF